MSKKTRSRTAQEKTSGNLACLDTLGQAGEHCANLAALARLLCVTGKEEHLDDTCLRSVGWMMFHETKRMSELFRQLHEHLALK